MEDRAKKLFSRESLDQWYSNYQKLEDFNKKTGTLPAEPDEELTLWADFQRSIRHMLPGELKKKLAALHFDFTSKYTSWDSMYRKLASFVENNGHTCLPAGQKFEALQDWLNRQILSRTLLSESQFRKLDNLGVDWNVMSSRDQRWESMYLRLQEFHRLYGHCRVPQKWAKDKQLALWVSVQRSRYSQNKLREDRERKLSELGFVWNVKTVFDAQWEQYYSKLALFHRKHGHCRVPGKHQKLVSWIERQRTARTNNLLPTEREERLNKLGFIWSFKDIKRKNWEKRYEQLCAYKQKHGHSFVPVNCSENKALGIWVATQRSLESKGKLGAAKKKKLSELGFVWSSDTMQKLSSAYEAQWESSFEKLKAYKQAHGTCQVSLKIDPVLQRWTSWQRKHFYQGSLSNERISRLNEICFPWSVQEEYWRKMYEALIDFKRQYGHTRVPRQWEQNPRLAAWLYRIRLNKQELSPQKTELLDKLGFEWTLHRKKLVPWSVMYSHLVKFKEQYGHTRVPVQWQEGPKLGKWVGRMRQGSEKLAPERYSLLETIGFDWGYKVRKQNRTSSIVT